MTHLLVTNDFPPKVGGIQSVLWELWRRLPPDEFTVLTTPYRGADEWDRQQPFRVLRSRQRVLLPTPAVVRQVDRLAAETGAALVVLDPALPLGAIGPRLTQPYALVLHGAEVTVPGRLPVLRPMLGAVLRGAVHVIAAGNYPSAEADRAAGRALPTTIVPPGVDTDLFHPLEPAARVAARQRLGLPVDAQLVVGISRLVPRKGFDVLIRAVAQLAATHDGVHLAIVGDGRDRSRLERLARSTGAPVTFLGRIPFSDLPAAYACGDVFAMLCRNRWGGLEQEGFGIVFLEAAAAGVAAVAGDSGGVADAVVHGETGLVVDRPGDPSSVATALAALLDDPARRDRLAASARRRAVDELDYDLLAGRLHEALTAVSGA